MNLLQETIEDIEASGHTVDDIIFIGSETSGHSCTWDEYTKLANIEYDEEYGGQEIASDLKIVFKDGADMTRGEYDGSEWWQYSRPFVMPTELKPIKCLCGGNGWNSLSDLNKD